MFGTPYNYNPQASLDRINSQIAELEKMKSNLQQQPMPQPTNLTQNFQLAPQNREVIRYANSIDEVQRDMVIGDTPYFSKDMAIVWIKNIKGEIRTFELKEIIPQDEKDVEIALLKAKIDELMKGNSNNARTDISNVDESIKSEKSTDVSDGRTSKAKSKQSNGNV